MVWAQKDIEGGGVNINNVREANAARTVTTNDLLFGKHVLLRKGKKIRRRDGEVDFAIPLDRSCRIPRCRGTLNRLLLHRSIKALCQMLGPNIPDGCLSSRRNGVCLKANPVRQRRGALDQISFICRSDECECKCSIRQSLGVD
jgi:hypothetical protein